MAKGQATPTVTQIPTMDPRQQQFLDTLLAFMPQAMSGFTLGEAYGGPGQANYSPITIGEGKGGAAPAGGGVRRDKPRPRRSPVDEALTGPIVSPFTQEQTGNYPRRRQ